MKVTRKELAGIISARWGENCSTDQVFRHEERWGLRPARGRDINKRLVRYDLKAALLALMKAGVIPVDPADGSRLAPVTTAATAATKTSLPPPR